MTQNKTKDLKNHCFAMMEELINPENDNAGPEKMKELIERAKAVANLGNTINNTLKIELTAINLANKHGLTPQDFKMIGDE